MVAPLTPALIDPTRAMLERRPLENLYFLSVLDHYGANLPALEGRAVVLLDTGGRVLGAADCGRNLVFDLVEATDHRTLKRLVEEAARIERGRHALVGRRELIGRFVELYRRGGARVLTVRDQILYAVGREQLRGESDSSVRPARSGELDLVLRAHAAMCLEDLGHDQVADNPEGYRRYFRQLIDQHRVWVVVAGRHLVFKAESGVESKAGAQVEGVYTDPGFRRRAFARGGLVRVCRDLLARVPRVTLYVNEHNRAAIALYEGMGFRKVCDWRTVVAQAG